MVTKCDLRCADLLCYAIQYASAQPSAQRTGRLIGVENVFDELPDSCVLNPILPAARLASLRDHVVLIPLVARVDVHRHERERDRRSLAEHVENLQEGPTIL